MKRRFSAAMPGKQDHHYSKWRRKWLDQKFQRPFLLTAKPKTYSDFAELKQAVRFSPIAHRRDQRRDANHSATEVAADTHEEQNQTNQNRGFCHEFYCRQTPSRKIAYMLVDMLRTTVYLDETTESELRILARKSGRSKAELMREALRSYVAKARSNVEAELPPGVGRYSSSRDDVSERVDVMLWVDGGDDA